MIIKSIIESRSEPQIDGRFWATELHTHDDGTEERYNTLFDEGTDVESVMLGRAAAMNEGEQNRELVL